MTKKAKILYNECAMVSFKEKKLTLYISTCRNTALQMFKLLKLFRMDSTALSFDGQTVFVNISVNSFQTP